MLSIGGLVQAQNNKANILLSHDNNPVDFTKLDDVVVKEAVVSVTKSSDEKIKNIVDVKKQTVSNTLLAYDDLQYGLSDL